MIIDFILVIFFTLQALAVAYYIIRSRTAMTWSSLVFCIGLAVTATVTFWSLENYRGYPVYAQSFAKNELIYGKVDRPSNGSKGRIFVWLHITDHEPTWLEKTLRLEYFLQPRAFEVPYSKEEAAKVEKALEQIKKGYVVEIEGAFKPKNDSDTDGQMKMRFVTKDPRTILQKK